MVHTVAKHVTGLHVVPREELSEWGSRLGVPSGWLKGRYTGDDPTQPWRIAVFGPQPDGGWVACETITVFAFNGTLPHGLLLEKADHTLRALESVNVTTASVGDSECWYSHGVCSTGFFSAVGLWVWGQCNYYLSDSDAFRQGLLIEQCLFVEADQRPSLVDDIQQLVDSVQSTPLKRRTES
ncbi:hypothetical protein FHT44_002511 [Mycolicibacterium sp. BK634]|nr:hypothetical protein [Mycolicibacterium sp. BK634]